MFEHYYNKILSDWLLFNYELRLKKKNAITQKLQTHKNFYVYSNLMNIKQIVYLL